MLRARVTRIPADLPQESVVKRNDAVETQEADRVSEEVTSHDRGDGEYPNGTTPRAARLLERSELRVRSREQLSGLITAAVMLPTGIPSTRNAAPNTVSPDPARCTRLEVSVNSRRGT